MLLAPITEIVGKVVRLTDDHLPGVKNRRGCVQEPVQPLHKTSASLSEEETVDTKRIFQLWQREGESCIHINLKYEEFPQRSHPSKVLTFWLIYPQKWIFLSWVHYTCIYKSSGMRVWMCGSLNMTNTIPFHTYSHVLSRCPLHGGVWQGAR